MCNTFRTVLLVLDVFEIVLPNLENIIARAQAICVHIIEAGTHCPSRERAWLSSLRKVPSNLDVAAVSIR
jgi:hypothetical protein